MKITSCLALILLFLGTANAFANFTFQCLDQKSRVASRMIISEKTRSEQKTEEVCNGGVGDPMVCENVTRLWLHKQAFLELNAAPKPMRTIIDVRKMTWKGSDPNDVSDYLGEGSIGPRHVEIQSAVGFSTDASYLIKVYAPESDRCVDPTCSLLRCRQVQ